MNSKTNQILINTHILGEIPQCAFTAARFVTHCQKKGNQWRTNTIANTIYIYFPFCTLTICAYDIWNVFILLELLWVLFTVIFLFHFYLFHLLWQCKHMYPMPIKHLNWAPLIVWHHWLSFHCSSYCVNHWAAIWQFGPGSKTLPHCATCSHSIPCSHWLSLTHWSAQRLLFLIYTFTWSSPFQTPLIQTSYTLSHMHSQTRLQKHPHSKIYLLQHQLLVLS